MINTYLNSNVAYSRAGYGPVLNTSNCVNDDYTTFANATPTGFDATSDGTATHKAGTADQIPLVSGNTYLVIFDMVLNSGTGPSYDFRSDFAGGSRTVEGAQIATNGSNSFTFTCDSSTTGILDFRNASASTDFEITNLSVREAL
jgi:hypothetical protein